MRLLLLMRLAAVLAWAVAGGCVFLALANRVLIQLRQSRFKMFVVFSVMAAIIALSGLS